MIKDVISKYNKEKSETSYRSVMKTTERPLKHAIIQVSWIQQGQYKIVWIDIHLLQLIWIEKNS